MAVLKLRGLLSEIWCSILLLIARARPVAHFLCHGPLYAWKRTSTSGAMPDSDAHLFGATDHSPDWQENSAAVTRECQTETKIGSIFILYVPVRNDYLTGQIHNYSQTQKINGVTVFHFLKCPHQHRVLLYFLLLCSDEILLAVCCLILCSIPSLVSRNFEPT